MPKVSMIHDHATANKARIAMRSRLRRAEARRRSDVFFLLILMCSVVFRVCPMGFLPGEISNDYRKQAPGSLSTSWLHCRRKKESKECRQK